MRCGGLVREFLSCDRDEGPRPTRCRTSFVSVAVGGRVGASGVDTRGCNVLWACLPPPTSGVGDCEEPDEAPYRVTGPV